MSTAQRTSVAASPLDGSASTLMDRLRRETHPAHQSLEDAMERLAFTASLDAYRLVVARFYGFYIVWEPAVAAAIADGAFFGPRRKLHLLERDLEWLGIDRRAVISLPSETLMPLSRVPEAMGSLYVLEGSTLGGQVIVKRLRRTLGLNPMQGCAFFHSYARQVAPMWAAFGARMRDISCPVADEAILHSAQLTFSRLRDWLCRGV